jgi:hypothetical protein
MQKRVQITRLWSSKKEAVLTVIECFSEVLETLKVVAVDESNEKQTVATALGLIITEFTVLSSEFLRSTLFVLI